MPQIKFLKDYRRLPCLLAGGTVFCAFDTETTGLHSQTDRVIEIGAVRFCMQAAGDAQSSGAFAATAGELGTVAAFGGMRAVVLDRFDALINPCIPLPAICAELSHITDGMVADKPACADVLPEFLRFIDGAVLVAHNAPFDVKFVNAELERAGLEPLSVPVLDTLRLSRTVLPANGHWSLQHLAQQFGIAVHAAHRADDDARVCMEVLLHLLQAQQEQRSESRSLADAALQD